jgi:hypothetical protein
LQEDGTMQSWKARLLMVFTMLALILAVSVPGMADVELECDAEDGGTCEEMVSYESESLEDEGTELEDESSRSRSPSRGPKNATPSAVWSGGPGNATRSPGVVLCRVRRCRAGGQELNKAESCRRLLAMRGPYQVRSLPSTR